MTMFLDYKELQARGVEVHATQDGLELTAQNHWPQKAMTNFRDFCLGIGLTDQESDELAGHAEIIGMMGAIKKSCS